MSAPRSVSAPEVVGAEVPANPEALAALRAGEAQYERLANLAAMFRREALEFRAGVVSEARDAGLTYDDIAGVLNVNRPRVYKIARAVPAVSEEAYARMVAAFLTVPGADAVEIPNRPALRWLESLRRKGATRRLRADVAAILDEQAPGWETP